MIRGRALWVGLASLAMASGCADQGAAPSPEAAVSSSARPARPVLLCLGDSLTAGYGVEKKEAWPSLLQEKLDAAGARVEVRNAGVSGSTTAGVLENVDWHLGPEVRWMILGIGANDGLRGLPLKGSRQNISSILDAARAKKIEIILAGMKIPPNYGEEYSREFESMYPDLARKFRAPLIPFLLDGVGGRSEMNLEDGIHPNPEGHRAIADLVFSFIEKNGLVGLRRP